MATSAAPVEEAKGQTGRPPPLTLSNVVKAVEGVDWKKLGMELHIPLSKQNDIERKGDNDDRCMTKLMEHWMLYDPSPSWRRIIVALDGMQARKAADRIRSHAEPVADPTLTLPRVTAAVKKVPERRRQFLAIFLGVPGSKRAEIKKQYTTDDRRMTAALDYWIKTVPKASWNQLAAALHYLGETALQKTRKHIQKQRDLTLNGDNVYSAVKDVQNWDDFLREINMPLAQQYGAERQYSGRAQQRRAAVDLWLKTHPAPSWEIIVEALYQRGEHHILRKVQELYVSASEESRRLFQDAMQHGSIDASAVKVVITGIAGAGKTCSKHVIIGENPPRIRRSTPCAERPVKVIRVDPSSFDWAKVDSHRVKELLAEVIKSRILGVIRTPRTAVFVSADGSNTSDKASASPQSTQAEDSLSHSVSKPDPESVGAIKSDEKPGGPPELETVRAEEERFTTEDELIKLIQVSQSSGSKPILNISLVHFVDSGGQPQFHEVLPVFLRGTSVCLFVIKLSEELKEHPLVEYYDEDGELIGQPYYASHTNEQILKHCVTTLQSHKSQAGKGRSPRILILGTHKDREVECKETRAEKNRKLIQMLLPDFEEEVIYYNEFDEMPQLIFPLNSRSPGPEDKEIAAEIRKLIMSQCSPETHQIPISWYALELLLRELAQSHGRQVLSTKRCLAAARNRLHFEDRSFVAALEYLDSLNLIFYYHKSLPNVIFIDPQVLLDKVSELVKFIFQRSGASRPPVAMKDEVMKFRRYGLLTIEFLKQFTQHYVADIFTPDDLIKLFRDLLILADFTPPQFFMPCLLRIIESSEVDQHLASSAATAAPLVLKFHRSPQNGMFCSLISFLLSPENESPRPWKLVIDPSRSLPKCLFRNCIKFQIPDSPGTITLVDSFKFFEVHVKAPSEDCSQLCPVVSDAVFAGLAKASATLSYSNCKTKKAFLCPCGSGDPHPATVTDNHRNWVCSEDPEEYGHLQPNQLLWLPQTSATQGSCAATLRLQETDLAILRDLIKHAFSHWREIGLNLGFMDGELNSIEHTPVLIVEGPPGYMRQLLSQWLKWAPPNHSWPTIEALACALRRVGEEAVAFNLRDRFETAKNAEPSDIEFCVPSTASRPSSSDSEEEFYDCLEYLTPNS